METTEELDEALERLCAAVGAVPLTDHEVTVLLALARVVAHGVERKLAPLSTFLAGLAVAGADAPAARTAALEEVAARMRATLPEG